MLFRSLPVDLRGNGVDDAEVADLDDDDLLPQLVSLHENNVLDSDQIKLTDVPVLHAKLHENSIDSLQNETVVVEPNISQEEAPPTNPTPTPPPPTAPSPTRPPSTPATPGGGGTQRGGGSTDLRRVFLC